METQETLRIQMEDRDMWRIGGMCFALALCACLLALYIRENL